VVGMTASSAPAPQGAVVDWLASLFNPGGNPDVLDRRAQQYAQVRDTLAQQGQALQAQLGRLRSPNEWSGQGADAFHHDGTDVATHLGELQRSYQLASQALAAQAEQKRHQQRQAEVLLVTIGLTALAVGLVALAPVALAAGGAAVAAEGVAAEGLAVEGAAAAEGAAAEGGALPSFLGEAASIGEEFAAYVSRTFSQALQELRTIMARTGLTRVQGFKSMKTIGGVTVAARAFDKGLASMSQRGWQFSNVLPALGDALNPLKWDATDIANTLFLTAAGPAIAVSPLADLIGLRVPAPHPDSLLSSALGPLADKGVGKVIGEVFDGAVMNGAATAVGAFALNGQPLDNPDTWAAIGRSTLTGGAAGGAGGLITALRPSGAISGGLDQTKALRLGFAFPADVAIAAGTRSPPPASTLPPGVPQQPVEQPQFQPTFVGGNQVTVQPGETLSSIAERDLRNAGQWPALQQANPDSVDGHQNLIRPGDAIDEPLLPDPQSPTK